jgi:hypothetical protein
MGSLVVRILGIVGAAILSVTTFGGGVASADGLIGKTYSEAAAAISGWKGTPVIATVSGDQLEKNDCIVTSWHSSIFLDSSGENGRAKEYLLNLNCNNRVASPGHPGNSMMTPDAALAKKELQAAANINKDPSYCDKDAAHARSCDQICKRTGLCEFRLAGTE